MRIRYFASALEVLRMVKVPFSTRLKYLYLTLMQRLSLPGSKQREGGLYLNRGVMVNFTGRSLRSDLEAFKDVFSEQYYHTDYSDSVVVDIGAHKGYYAAYALISDAHVVHSYEPEANNFTALRRAAESFRLHGYLWHIHKTAVGPSSGEVDLYVAEHSYSHSLVQSNGSACVQVERVSMVPMQSALREACTSPDRRLIVKINAEGAECDMVINTPVSSWHAVHEVFVAVHGFARCSSEDIIEHLKSAGLTVKSINGNGHIHMVRV